MFRLRSLCLGATRDQAGEPRRLPRSIALLAAVVLFLVLAPPASAIQFVSTWGWGVEDGANQYETCTSACQQGIYGSGAGQFGRPFGIATDSSGNVYVGDYHHNRIEKFSSSGAFISAWGWGVTDGAARYEICTSSCQAGISGSGDDQFADPVAIATDSSDNVYVADEFNNRIQKFSSSGAFITKWGAAGSGDGQFNQPTGVATDSLDNVYVADWSNNRIQKFSSSGTFITKWGSIGSGNTEFDHPTGVTTDSSDNVYVSDQNNARIAKFSSSGTFITKWGSSGSGNGQFSIPQDVATDSSDNVYVADYGNDRIQKFSSSGTFLAKTGSAGSGDGQFDSPSGVAIDSADNIYVTDSFNYRIQKFFKAPQTQIDSGPSGLTNDSTPTFGFSSDTPGSTFECRLDSNQEADFQLCTSPQSYGLLTDGTHTFEVRATDQAGNTDPTPASRTFTVDTTPPTVTAPVQSLVLGNQISNSSSSVPVRLRWSGSDDRTSLSNLKFDVNGRIYRSGSWGAWSPVLADTSLRATTRYLIPDKKYQYEARSKDQAGNVSAFKAGPGFTPRLLQESAATYTGTWSTEAQSDASGGSVKTSSQAGATASFAFTERNVGVVMPLRSTLGSVKICLDPGTASESCSTVDLSPSSGLGARKIVFARNGLSTAVQHRVKITVLSGRADLDALAVLG